MLKKGLEAAFQGKIVICRCRQLVPNMFMSASRLLPRLASTRLPLNNTPRSSLSRCSNLHANEQGKGVRENPTGAKQAPRPTGTEESAESSRDTFGTLSSSLANRNLQRRLDNEWFQDEDDDEDEFRQKIEDTLRPRYQCYRTGCEVLNCD